jgi:haloalkane dehalogenase
MDTGVYRAPDERFDGLPGYNFQPHYLELEGELAGLRAHHVDEGSGDPIVLLHGEPTWAYLYRKLVGPLSTLGRVIVPDMIGFGRSDKVTDRSFYSYARHCDWLAQVMDRLELERVTLVVHDWGGPIGLRWATDHPERVARLVVLNTGIYRGGESTAGPAWLAFREFVIANPDLPVGDIIQAATVTDVPAEVIAAYEAPYDGEASKAGAATFPLLYPLEPGAAGAAEMMATAEALTRWERPTLVCFSDSDPVFSPRSGERLAERVPGTERFVVIEGASHFLQEDAGERIAAEIAAFVERTP